MRSLIKTATVILVFIPLICYTQEPDTPIQQDYYPYSLYLGSSTGINSKNGILGIFGELPLNNKVSLEGGLGICLWGFRTTLGAKLYKHFPKGIYYSGGISFNSGIPEIEVSMQDDSGETEFVTMNFNKAQTINLALGYQFSFLEGKLNLYLEGGYALPLQSSPYEVLSNHELSHDSENMMDLLAPGGLILSTGLTIGFFK